MGLLYCFLTVTLRANQNVTGLAMTTFGVGFGNFFGGSLIKLVDSRRAFHCLNRHEQLTSANPCPFAAKNGTASANCSCPTAFWRIWQSSLPWQHPIFLNHTRTGLHLRAVGENPNTADAAGINVIEV